MADNKQIIEIAKRFVTLRDRVIKTRRDLEAISRAIDSNIDDLMDYLIQNGATYATEAIEDALHESDSAELNN